MRTCAANCTEARRGPREPAMKPLVRALLWTNVMKTLPMFLVFAASSSIALSASADETKPLAPSTAAPLVAPPIPTAAPSKKGLLYAGLASIGAGTAFLIAGGTLYSNGVDNGAKFEAHLSYCRQNYSDDLNCSFKAPGWPSNDGALDRFFGVAMLGIGAGAATTGIVMALVGAQPTRPSAMPSVAVGPRSASALWVF